LRGSASAAPPRHGAIRVGTGGNEERGNEHDEAQSPGGPTEDPRRRDGPVRDDRNPRKAALELTRRLVLERTVRELRARVDALAPGAAELAEARDEIARLRGLVRRGEGSGPGGPPAGRSRPRTPRVSFGVFRVVALGGVLWLAIANLSVHSDVGRLLRRQREFEGEERRRAYLRKGAASEENGENPDGEERRRAHQRSPGRPRRRHAGEGAAAEENGKSPESAPRVGARSDSNSTAGAADGGWSAGSAVNGTSIDDAHSPPALQSTCSLACWSRSLVCSYPTLE